MVRRRGVEVRMCLTRIHRVRDPGQLGDQLEGTQPVGRVIDHGGEHQLVGGGGRQQLGQAVADRLGRADDLGGL
jgi:hypothetical protein